VSCVGYIPPDSGFVRVGGRDRLGGTMRWSMRSLFVVCVALALVLGVMPARAVAAVTLTPMTSIGGPGTGDGQFEIGPADVAADKFGNIYAVAGLNYGAPPYDHRIQMFSATGQFIRAYENPGAEAEQVSLPHSISTDRWGRLYVTTEQNPVVDILMSGLYGYDRRIGAAITDPIIHGQDVDVALDGTMYIASENGVEIRSKQGDVIGAVPLAAGLLPFGVGLSQDGIVYVGAHDAGNIGTIRFLRPDGVGGYWAAMDPYPYSGPLDVDVDPAGTVFIAEYGAARVQLRGPNSDLITAFGDAVTIGSPFGLGVGSDRMLYVADPAHQEIDRWKVNVPTTEAEVEGTNRYLTAIEASKKAYPNGADVAVLTTGENWPDALGGAALAGVLGGPLLLTPHDVLPASVAAELDRLKVKGVYVLGGTGAVSDDVLNAAKALTPLGAAERLGGLNRYETANKIAERVVSIAGSGYDGTAFVCTGADFPDALAAAPIAAANGWPIYLTQTAALTPSTKTKMGVNGATHGYVIGGTGAVSAAVETELDATFIEFSRVGGANRYDTAAKLANEAFDGMGMLWSRPALAVGTNFPDALAGGVLQGSDCSVLLLTSGATLSPAAAAALSANREMIYELRYLGGDGVLSLGVRSAARALLP